jgi:hypothetical protein
MWAEREGRKEDAMRIWAMLPTGEMSRTQRLSQRQIRKAKRQAWAAGVKTAFD